MKTSTRCAALMVAATLGGLAAAVPAASAQGRSFVHLPLAGVRNATALTTTESTVSGYLSLPSAVTSLKGGNIVPSVDCPATGEAFLGQTVQIDGGTEADPQYAGLFINELCESGVASYSADTFIGSVDDAVTFTVAPGNKVGALVTDTAAGSIKVEAENVSTDKTYTQTGSQAADTDYYGWVLDQNSGEVSTVPIPSFSTPIEFEMIVNGEPVSAEAPTSYTMYNGSDLMISTSALSNAGDTFTTSFVATS